MPAALENLFSAIVRDDRMQVESLLASEPGLGHGRASAARLHTSQICHWLYVGDTPLHLAAAGYRVEIMRTLLAAGADPRAAANHRHSSPLHYAADTCITESVWNPTRQVAAIRCLLAAGAEVDAQDKNGAAALHRAVRTRGAAAVEVLLDSGCNPTLKNNPGSTPFHLAVQNTGRGGSGDPAAKAAQRQIIRLFIARGISDQIRNANGVTVRDSATSQWIRDLLEESRG